MAQCDVWRNVSSQEFDNAIEGMEKLIMNRLYSQTFAPAVLGHESLPIPPSPVTQPSSSLRRRASKAGSLGDDLERDNILMQKIKVFSWITEVQLDIPKNTLNRSFVSLAKQGLRCFIMALLSCIEFVKINNYRAPRDKVICILNCCKVIFGTVGRVWVFSFSKMSKGCFDMQVMINQLTSLCLCLSTSCCDQMFVT